MITLEQFRNSPLRWTLHYDPFSLFFQKLINPNMMFSGESILDTELFTIGKQAFDLLGIYEKDDFENGLKAFKDWNDIFKETLSKRTDVKVLFIDHNGVESKIDFDEMESDSLLSVAWQFFEKIKQDRNVDLKDFDSNGVFFELYLFQVFYSIQDCLFSMIANDVYSGISSAIAATRMLNNAQAISSKDEALINLRRELGYNAAIARLKKDPKQKALDEICNEYESRKSQFKRRGYSAQFIRDMHDKYPVITAIKTIETLVSGLNKKNEHIPR